MHLSYCTFHDFRCQVACRLACAFLVVCIAGCSRDRSVELTLDFSRAPQWRYALEASVHGTIATAQARRAFMSAAQCTLLCTVDAKNVALLHVTVPYARFSSNMLDDAELENLMEQAREVRIACNLRDGMIAPEDSAALPLIQIGEWDVFKDLATTIPALPKIAVKPGATWDREKAVPIDTRHGTAMGHLLQSFRLDSIALPASGKRVAHVGWSFTYLVDLRRDRDANGFLDSMPSKGNGTGGALINLDDKTLETASMSFSVASPKDGTFGISWDENISLNLVR
jgi:hypothetical protein